MYESAVILSVCVDVLANGFIELIERIIKFNCVEYLRGQSSNQGHCSPSFSQNSCNTQSLFYPDAAPVHTVASSFSASPRSVRLAKKNFPQSFWHINKTASHVPNKSLCKVPVPHVRDHLLYSIQKNYPSLIRDTPNNSTKKTNGFIVVKY